MEPTTKSKKSLTGKQRIVIQELLNNPTQSVASAMRKAGYSESTVTTQKIRKSQPFKDLMDALLPDEKLLQVHHEGLYAVKRTTSLTEPDQLDPDFGDRVLNMLIAF